MCFQVNSTPKPSGRLYVHVFRLSLPGPTASVLNIIGGLVVTRLFVVLSCIHKCSWLSVVFMLFLKVDH